MDKASRRIKRRKQALRKLSTSELERRALELLPEETYIELRIGLKLAGEEFYRHLLVSKLSKYELRSYEYGENTQKGEQK